MSRRCTETIEVRRGDEAPEQFLWRGRLYLVRAVLASWTESGGWWHGSAARPLFGVDEAAPPSAGVPVDDLVLAAIPSAPKWGQRAWGEPAPDVGAAVGGGTVDDGERECWRVEAGTGHCAGTGIYDLCFDWGAGVWTITCVLD
ncbi:MAG: DUF6504 family protein [Frankiaceae bacterium]